MKVSIETIGDKHCTVIRKPFDAEWVAEQINMEQSVLACTDERAVDYFTLWNYSGEDFMSGGGKVIHEDDLIYTLTILPALPRNPKPEDAPLLYRYMAEGIEAISTLYDDGAERFVNNVDFLTMLSQLKHYGNKEVDGGGMYIQITHAIDVDGNKLEVAIHDQ